MHPRRVEASHLRGGPGADRRDGPLALGRARRPARPDGAPGPRRNLPGDPRGFRRRPVGPVVGSTGIAPRPGDPRRRPDDAGPDQARESWAADRGPGRGRLAAPRLAGTRSHGPGGDPGGRRVRRVGPRVRDLPARLAAVAAIVVARIVTGVRGHWAG